MEADEDYQLGEYKALFEEQGNFTICSICNQVGNVVAMGSTKRNPIDPDYKYVGKEIAFSRAVKNLNSD